MGSTVIASTLVMYFPCVSEEKPNGTYPHFFPEALLSSRLPEIDLVDVRKLPKETAPVVIRDANI